ncbi:MAG: aminotransferase class I/II-fold pyridoxal phosphate-dependent enzyme [Anaerolineae bacterium]|nr:aminotransferase class I/II-fold pyridoxal phosphate-dependent enzyme [Anaerolineae bacterium]
MNTQGNLSIPEFAVETSHLIPVHDYPAHMTPIQPSRMFTIRNALAKYKEKYGQDAPVYDASQGDGGASLPGVPKALLLRAADMQVAHGTGYDNPFGTQEYRVTMAEKYWGFTAETGFGPGNIIFTQGGRDGLNKAYAAMIALGNGRVGDALVVSRVPWVSYNWGPYSMGLNVLRAPGDPAQGWKYTPESIKATADFAAEHGRRIAGIVITSPDNPTGLTLSVEEQILLAKTALEAGYPFVLFDWMYHRITDDGTPTDINRVLLAFTPAERERLMVLDGITKSLGASNIRSAHLVASKKVVDYVNTQASHGVTPSYYAQAIAIAACEQGFTEAAASLVQPIAASRKLLRGLLEQSDVPFIMGHGYYAFLDLTRYIQAGGYDNSEGMGSYLAEEFGIAVVPGVHFSSAGEMWVRFSYALPPEKTEKAAAQFFAGLQALVK